MVVFVADEDPLTGTSHSMFNVMLLEPLEACKDGGIFFGLGFFSTKGVVRQRVEANCPGLVAVEGLGEDGRIGCLKSSGGYSRHLELKSGDGLAEKFRELCCRGCGKLWARRQNQFIFHFWIRRRDTEYVQQTTAVIFLSPAANIT